MTTHTNDLQRALEQAMPDSAWARDTVNGDYLCHAPRMELYRLGQWWCLHRDGYPDEMDVAHMAHRPAEVAERVAAVVDGWEIEATTETNNAAPMADKGMF